MKRVLAIFLVLILCGCGQRAFDASCTVTVDCASVLEQADESLKARIPQDGVLFSGEVEFASGESLLDVFTRAMREAKIPAVREGAYLSSIGGVQTGDFGPMSGWLFTVNGEYATVGCEAIFPQDGDTIEWVYITEWNE